MNMGEILKRRLKMKRNPEPREEALLNVSVASSFLKSSLENVSEKHSISPTQYNVLRILNGVYPDGHPRCEIIIRMIDKAPDITRLIDRLEKQGLVERTRSGEDRRLSLTKITTKGQKLLKTMQPILETATKDVTKNLNTEECKELSRLCEKIYEEKQ